MNILGNRVYLDMPEIKETKLSINENLKRELKEDEVKKFDKLTVFALGEGSGEGKLLIEKIKIGDQVLVEPSSLRTGSINITNIDGKDKLVVSVFNIAHIW